MCQASCTHVCCKAHGYTQYREGALGFSPPLLLRGFLPLVFFSSSLSLRPVRGCLGLSRLWSSSSSHWFAPCPFVPRPVTSGLLSGWISFTLPCPLSFSFPAEWPLPLAVHALATLCLTTLAGEVMYIRKRTRIQTHGFLGLMASLRPAAGPRAVRGARRLSQTPRGSHRPRGHFRTGAQLPTLSLPEPSRGLTCSSQKFPESPGEGEPRGLVRLGRAGRCAKLEARLTGARPFSGLSAGIRFGNPSDGLP